MTWMQRLKRVFAMDIETCPKRGVLPHLGQVSALGGMDAALRRRDFGRNLPR